MAVFLVWFLIGLARYYVPALDSNADINAFYPPPIIRVKKGYWRRRNTRNKDKQRK
jgi:hypothetical protein